MKLFRLYVLAAAIPFALCGTSFASSPTQKDAIEVPFSYENGQIYIPVKLSGKEAVYPMLLVSGVKRSVIHPSVAVTAGLVITISNPLAADYDPNYTRQAMARRVVIGNLEFGNLDVGIAVRGDANGVLGSDFLKHYVTQIDFPNRLIRFYKTSPFPKGPASVAGVKSVVPMKLDGLRRVPVIEDVVVNGKKIKVSLDTGFGGKLALTPAAVKHLGLTTKKNTDSKYEEQNIESLVVGSLKFESLTAWLYNKGSGYDMGLESIGGVIGNGFLENFVVTLDYKNKVAVLQ